MSAARKFLPAEEQNLPAGARNMTPRLSSLGIFLETHWHVRDAMRKGRPLSDASAVVGQLRASMIGVFGNFKIEATAVYNGARIVGWRVTTNDWTTSLQHEFYVHGREIYHVTFQSSPNHSSQFVVGRKVKRLPEDEKRAMQRAIRDLTETHQGRFAGIHRFGAATGT